ncbi:hypothetical protein ACHAW5_005900 [Stephanodiscus triporus]|uniref:PDZ domain-containing protein n=1 Tax=Stephanodiscus triporus TaxID=2934178 RepID=A0ABD3ND18_9STRA
MGNYDGDDGNDKPPTSALEYNPSSQQEVRTTSVSSGGDATWTLGGGDQSSPSPPKSVSIAHDTQTVGTVDYDYVAAFGGAGDHSLSDVGGTVGSRTRETGAEGMVEDVTAMAPPGSGHTIFPDDLTFDQAYEDICEVILDVYAPAGKLGVIIDTPDDGAPMIHAIKDDSPIVDRVRVGDKLVAVDDEDVRPMTARKVSKLISTKMNNPSRKLTIIRQERRAGPVG